jgi:hypothetical protein
MPENFTRSIEEQSMEVLMAVHQFDEQYRSRIETLKDQITAIYKTYKKREEVISENADQYTSEKVLDQLYNLRKSVRQDLTELVRGRGFLQELDAAKEELEKDETRNDVQQLAQTMKEIELRSIMRAAGADFQMTFQGAIMEGDPLTIEAIENAPIPFPIDAGIFEDGKKRRLEVLRPLAAKRYHALLQAQGTLEGLANRVMPIGKDDIDPLKDIVDGAPYGENVAIG